MSGNQEEIKLTLLGNAGVGKTCIISKYIDNTFSENNESTIGANYSEKIIKKNGKEIQLNIWDTAGQEKFHSLGKHFYKDAMIVCLVYDITNQDSLDKLREVWYPDLKKYGENCEIIAIVGNKCDLYEKDELADEEEARAFANQINATFMLTSAKTGDGIEKLFDTLAGIYLSPNFKQKAEENKRKRGPSFVVSKNDGEKKEKNGCC